MYFEIIGEITAIERIAAGPSIRELGRLRKTIWTWSLAQVKGPRARKTSEWQDAQS